MESTRTQAAGAGRSRKKRERSSARQRVNIILPDEVHTLAKVIAVAKGMTLAEFFALAIESAVGEGDELLKRSLDRLRGAP